MPVVKRGVEKMNVNDNYIVNLSSDELILIDHIVTAIERDKDEVCRVLKRSRLEFESDFVKLRNSIRKSMDFYNCRW